MPSNMGISPQPVLLGFLMTAPHHGYELHQVFSRDLGRVWQIGLSKLYAQLKQLEDAGLVISETEPQPNRPPRKVYGLTPEGREAFLDWVYQPTPYVRHIRVEFLARLYFFQRLSLPRLDQLVVQQKAVCTAQIKRFERLADDTEVEFRQLVLEFRRGQLEAVIRWLDRCLEILSDKDQPSLTSKQRDSAG
ncbi:MAG: PadR family transcriptional regulator [Anaerolineae bacterium]